MRQTQQKKLQKTTSPQGQIMLQQQQQLASQQKTQISGQPSSNKLSGNKTGQQSMQKTKVSNANQNVKGQSVKGNNLDLQEQEIPQQQVQIVSNNDQTTTKYQNQQQDQQQHIDHSNNYQVKHSSGNVQKNQSNNHFQYTSNNANNQQQQQQQNINDDIHEVDIELRDDITPIGNLSQQQDSVSHSRIEPQLDDQDIDGIGDMNHQQIEEIVDPKYGDQKIDLSEIINQQNANQLENSTMQHQEQIQTQDPTRPVQINNVKFDPNQPLPSYSNKVNIGEFSVGNFKEYQLREDLSKLIEKYNKQFYGDAKRPAIQGQTHHQTDKDSKYKEKMIINPIAVPQPGSTSDNFSWMCLMTPYYNQLVKEFNTQQLENHILQQHFEYYIEMEKEKELLNQDFNLLRKAEIKLQEQLDQEMLDNQTLEEKVEYMDRNLHVVHPERFREMNEKVENLSNVLKAKDNVIDQLLNEIALIKNEKDDLQNDVLFKKQRLENLNFEFNTKELEYQRLWEEEQNLKADMRGDTSHAKDVQRENEMLIREIAMVRDEIAQNQAIYEQRQLSIQEQRSKLQDYEERLRYGNEVIMQLESEGQSISLDIAQQKAYIEGQTRAYNELKNNFQLLSTKNMQDGSLQMSSNPMITIPKLVNPSSYFKPSITTNKATINLLPSPSKALSQHVAPSNIKSYLSVKKTVIDLTSDIGHTSGSAHNRTASRDQKVRFSVQDQQSTDSMHQSSGNYFPSRSSIQQQRRSDSLDARIDKRNFKGLLNDNHDHSASLNFDNPNQRSPGEQNHVRTSNFTRTQLGEGPRVQSVNRNFVDTMSSLLGGSGNDDRQQITNMRASVQSNNTFPLKRVDISNVGNSNFNSPQKSILKDSFIRDSPSNRHDNNNRYRDMPTDVSTDYHDDNHNMRMSTMSTQTPFKNKVAATSRGGPGNRNSQPLQQSNVKQRQLNQHSQQQQPQAPRSNSNHFGREEQKFREGAGWQERMSYLPKNSAYKSSLTFGSDGITINDETNKRQNQNQGRDNYLQQSQPFKMARDYDIDITGMNEDDPQAKTQIVKFKQQKIYELTDQRKLLQSQISHIPENAKQISQRNKRQELDSEIQKITKRISVLKYDVKKLTCKDDE